MKRIDLEEILSELKEVGREITWLAHVMGYKTVPALKKAFEAQRFSSITRDWLLKKEYTKQWIDQNIECSKEIFDRKIESTKVSFSKVLISTIKTTPEESKKVVGSTKQVFYDRLEKGTLSPIELKQLKKWGCL